MILWMFALTMAAELGLHCFPWRLMLKGKDLQRVVAYTLGVCGLMVPFSLWLWVDQSEIIPILWLFVVAGGLTDPRDRHLSASDRAVLWLFVMAGGLTVLGLYGLDRLLDLEMQDIEAAR